MRPILLVFALLPVLAGCSKAASHASTAHAPDSYDAAPVPTSSGGGVRSPSVPSPSVESMAEESGRPSWRERREARKAAQAEMASPEPQAAPVEESIPPNDAAADGAAPAEPAVEKEDVDDLDARYIIYTAHLSMAVFNLDEARSAVETLPESYGGYVQQMGHDVLVLRLPSKNLRRAMADVEALGIVQSRNLQAQDVTERYVDLESRIRVLEETRDQLIALLDQARTVEEALRVRQSLDQLVMELEVLKGQLRSLQNLVTYSTLTVRLAERGPRDPTPSSNDPFPWVDSLGVEATQWR